MSRATVVTVPASVLAFLSGQAPWREVKRGIPEGFVTSCTEDRALMRRLQTAERNRRGAARMFVARAASAEDLRYWAAVVADEAPTARVRRVGAALVRRLDDALGVPSGRRYGL